MDEHECTPSVHAQSIYLGILLGEALYINQDMRDDSNTRNRRVNHGTSVWGGKANLWVIGQNLRIFEQHLWNLDKIFGSSGKIFGFWTTNMFDLNLHQLGGDKIWKWKIRLRWAVWKFLMYLNVFVKIVFIVRELLKKLLAYSSTLQHYSWIQKPELTNSIRYISLFNTICK